MRNIKTYEEETWKFFENGHFNLNKSHFPFSAIGSDHVIEQLKQELKVVGGVKGLFQNENALRRFILCAPVLNIRVRGFSQKKQFEEGVKK